MADFPVCCMSHPATSETNSVQGGLIEIPFYQLLCLLDQL